MRQIYARNKPQPQLAPILCACLLLAWTSASSATISGATAAPRNFRIAESPLTNLLAQKSVHEIFQDSSGFLWIRTQDAVHRYDGYKMRTFAPSVAGLGNLGHGSGPQLAEDPNGTIWMATLGKGLMHYDPRQRRFRSALAATDSGPGLPAQDVSTIYASISGAIWLGALNGELHRFNPQSRLIDRKLLSGSSSGSIVGIVEDENRRLWVATSAGSLFTCAAPHTSCDRYGATTAAPAVPAGEKFSTLAIDRVGRLWLGTVDAGLYLIDVPANDVRHFRHKPGTEDSIAANSIRRIYIDKQGRTWVGTDRGLNVFLGDNRFKRFDASNSYLGDYTVLGLYQDQTNKFWIGTHFGLYTAKETFFETIDKNRGLPSNISTAFAKYRDPELLVATYDGLFLFNTSDGEFSRLNIPGFRLRDPRVMSIHFEDPYLWIGYRAHGLDAVNVDTGAHHQLVAAAEDLQRGAVSDILGGADKNLLVATFGDGLYTFSSEANLVSNFRQPSPDQASPEQSSISSDKLFTLTRTRDADVLIGTLNGLSHYSSHNGKISTVAATGGNPDFPANTQLLAIAEDTQGNIWLGSQNAGLGLWQQADRAAGRHTFSAVHTTPTMPSSTIYAIEIDAAGKLWISTTRGLVRLDPQTRNIITFDRSDGLQDDEFNAGASVQDSNGRLYFGGNRGFNRFSPEDMLLDMTPPPLRLTEVTIDGEALTRDAGYLEIQTLDLSFRQRLINFEFSALDYTNPDSNRYKYKLENFDQDWVELGHKHDIGFTNLPSGKFLLRISGANSRGVWNNNGIRIPISVYPPPWLRWWAFSLYGALLMALSILLRKFYDTYQMKEQATKLAAELHDTAELAMDDLEDQLEIEQQLLLNVHNHAAHTLKLVADLLDRQAESIDDDTLLYEFADNQQRLTCLQLIENNTLYTAHLLELDFYKFLEELFNQIFPLEIRPELEVVPINEALNQKLEMDMAIPLALITNELVINSARHAFETATGIQTVRVHLQEKETRDGWVLEVADSGCGIPPGISPLNPTTLGMDIIARCSQQLHAKVTLDLAKGTLFRFEIPRTRPDHSAS